jgi:hypothetical protein
MAIKELFDPKTEFEKQTVRPLGNISDFVVEDWPLVLVGLRSGTLAQSDVYEQLEMLTRNKKTLIGRNGTEDKVNLARIDLLFLELGFAHLGGQPPVELSDWVEELSRRVNRPPCLTYEDLVITNPSGDWRKFTTGEIGHSEAAFYQTHKWVEEILGPATWEMFSALQQLVQFGFEGVPQACNTLVEVTNKLANASSLVRELGEEMPQQHYGDGFRLFLNPHPHREGMFGPSGQFTATIPVFDTLLAGENLPKKIISYRQQRDWFFPKAGLEQMKQAWAAVNERGSLVSLTKSLGKPVELVLAIDGLIEELKDFRTSHYKAVVKQNPESLAGKVSGTSGEIKVAGFLKSRLKINYWGDK